MTNRVFVTADCHFGHAKVIEFEAENRPFATIEQHDDELVYRWNHVVRKHDTVWVLGDVVFGRSNLPTLARLNGVKRLVMGNHDQFHVRDYLEYFSTIHACVKKSEFIMTHVPVHPGQLYRFIGNIHGHCHSRPLADPRYACVSVENTNLAPVLLDSIMHLLRVANQRTT